jgi:hypothetical protein
MSRRTWITTGAAHAAGGRLRRRLPRLLLAGAVPAVLLTGGAALVAAGLSGPGGGPHPRPLPARTFNLAPAVARSLPGPARLARPQPGSIQADCTPLPAGQPQVTIPSLCVYAPLVPTRVAGGVLLIPADVHQAALDAGSAALGARHGTTIIAAHVDSFSQGDGAFASSTRSGPAPSLPSPARTTRSSPGGYTRPPWPTRPACHRTSGRSPARAASSWSPAAVLSCTPPQAPLTRTTSSSTQPQPDSELPCRPDTVTTTPSAPRRHQARSSASPVYSSGTSGRLASGVAFPRQRFSTGACGQGCAQRRRACGKGWGLPV